MQIEKFLTFLPAALSHVSQRMRLPLVSSHTLYLLHIVKRLPRTARADLYKYTKLAGRGMHLHTLASYLQDAVKYELLHIDNGSYKLTPKGYEFIARVNRYFHHKRFR